MSLFDYLGTLGHYNYRDCDWLSMMPKHKGKGHNKQAHKNNYKQKRKNKKK